MLEEMERKQKEQEEEEKMKQVCNWQGLIKGGISAP